MTAVDTSTGPDTAALEAFGDRMMGILNGACTALMMSIGNQTGLFDALSAGPATSRCPCGPGAAERALRARVAQRPDRGPGGHPRSRVGHLRAPGRACGLGDDGGRAEQPGAHDAVPADAGRGGTGHRRLLPERRWPLLRPLPALSRLDGRGECCGGRRSAGGRHRAAGRRAAPAATRRDRRRGHRLRQRSRHQCPGSRLSRKPFRRLRLLHRSDRGGAGGGQPSRSDQRSVRGQGRGDAHRVRCVRPGHRLRRDPRPGPSGDSAGCSRAVVAPRRRRS